MDRPTETAVIVVPEIRDYQRINLAIVGHLEAGHSAIELQGVEGQRLLVAGLKGDWAGTVLVRGNAGPDLAAGLDAPRLKVICYGNAADGAGHSLASGIVWVTGNVGACVGYAQTGGFIVVEGNTGPRPGLNQKAGELAVLGRLGALASERRSGGILSAASGQYPRHFEYAATGGNFSTIDRPDADFIGRLERYGDVAIELKARIEAVQALRTISEAGVKPT